MGYIPALFGVAGQEYVGDWFLWRYHASQSHGAQLFDYSSELHWCAAVADSRPGDRPRQVNHPLSIARSSYPDLKEK